MNLSFLEQQIQNDIIMMQRPSYPFTDELVSLSDWYDDESAFCEENKIRWVLDAIRLRRVIEMEILEIQFEKYLTIDIGGNIL